MVVLEQIPMRQDNYSYSLIKNDEVIMIDPSEEKESKAYFTERPALKLIAIINTHGHADHVGGNDVLWKMFRCPVFGPEAEQSRIPHCSESLKGKEEFNLLGLSFKVFDVHAHTIGHLAFLLDYPIDEVIKHGHNKPPYVAHDLAGHRILFVGDSLFAAGCGRLFEGTPQDLANSLSFYARQDPEILMACAHEYTAANLHFAQVTFPKLPAIKKRLDAIDALLKEEGASVPCFFKEELDTNPFLLAIGQERAFLAEKYNINVDDLPSIVGALRTAKDNF